MSLILKITKTIARSGMKVKLLLMCFVIIIPIFAAGVYLIFNMFEVLNTSAENETYTDVENVKYRFIDTLVTVESISDSVYENNSNVFWEENENILQSKAEAYSKQIENALSSYPQILDINFYIKDAKENILPQQLAFDETIENSYWYREIMRRNNPVWQVMKNPNIDDFGLVYGKQIFDTDGIFIGVMLTYVSPEWIYGLLEDKIYDIVFTTENGLVFYSTIENYPAGEVYLTFPHLEEIGFTASVEFDYDNHGNGFKLYLVKPNFAVTGDTKTVINGYMWYVSLCFILSILLTILFTGNLARRIKSLNDEMYSVTLGNYELSENFTGNDEIASLHNNLKVMVDSMQKLLNENYEAKLQAQMLKFNQTEAEFKTLASQINPHFLYNTLETIRMKAYVNDDKETASLVKKLGKFMRRCLEVKVGAVPLKSELEFTEGYLEIQSARFSDRATYNINCDIDTSYEILPLIIQPIVENAFIHGIENNKKAGHIDINIYQNEAAVFIDVVNNGTAIPAEKLLEIEEKLEVNDTSSGKSIGLTNVNKRIKLYCGDNYGLSIFSDDERTKVSIKLPIDYKENSADFSTERL